MLIPEANRKKIGMTDGRDCVGIEMGFELSPRLLHDIRKIVAAATSCDKFRVFLQQVWKDTEFDLAGLTISTA